MHYVSKRPLWSLVIRNPNDREGKSNNWFWVYKFKLMHVQYEATKQKYSANSILDQALVSSSILRLSWLPHAKSYGRSSHHLMKFQPFYFGRTQYNFKGKQFEKGNLVRWKFLGNKRMELWSLNIANAFPTITEFQTFAYWVLMGCHMAMPSGTQLPNNPHPII